MKQLIFAIIICSLMSYGSCSNRFTKSEAWTYGTLCSIAISITALLASLFNIFVVKKAPKSFKAFLEIIIMFGCGALLGDAYVRTNILIFIFFNKLIKNKIYYFKQ